MDLPVFHAGQISPPAAYQLTLSRTFGFVRQEAINFGHCAVVSDHGESVVGSVQDQVLAHDGQTDEAEITTRGRPRRSADINAGQARAEVSQLIMSDVMRG